MRMVLVEGREESQHSGGVLVGRLLDRRGEVVGSLVVGGGSPHEAMAGRHSVHDRACAERRAPSGVRGAEDVARKRGAVRSRRHYGG